MTPNEALVLHLDLLPLGIGSITYYLPVLVNDESLITANQTENVTTISSTASATAKKKTKRKAAQEENDGGKMVGYDDYNIEHIKNRATGRRERRKQSENEEDENEEEPEEGDDDVAMM
jgi:hypothetical protein